MCCSSLRPNKIQGWITKGYRVRKWSYQCKQENSTQQKKTFGLDIWTGDPKPCVTLCRSLAHNNYPGCPNRWSKEPCNQRTICPNHRLELTKVYTAHARKETLWVKPPFASKTSFICEIWVATVFFSWSLLIIHFCRKFSAMASPPCWSPKKCGTISACPKPCGGLLT